MSLRLRRANLACLARHGYILNDRCGILVASEGEICRIYHQDCLGVLAIGAYVRLQDLTPISIRGHYPANSF